MGGTKLVGAFIDLKESVTPPNPPVDIGRIYIKDVAGATTLFFRDNAGVETVLLDGGDPQTPWGSNIDAANFNLLNMGFIESNTVDPADIGFLRMAKTDLIAWRNNANTNNMTLSLNPFDNFVFTDNGSIEYTFGSAKATWNGNALEGFDYLASNAAIPATAGEIRLGNTESIEFRNATNDANVSIGVDATNFVNVSGGRGINLDNDDSLRWAGLDARRILNDTLGFQFSVEAGDDIRLHWGGTDEYDFDETQSDWKGNNIINVGVFESNAGNPSTVGTVRLGNNQVIGWRTAGDVDDVTFGYNDIDSFIFKDKNRALQMRLVAEHTTPANGQEAAGIIFEDDNSIGTTRAYAQIAVLIENPTSGSERGEMKLQMIGDSGLFESYIILNDADDDAVTIEKKLQIADAIDFKKITIPSDPPTEEGRLYVKQIDANNNALFVKIKVAGSIQEVRLS